MDKSWIQRPRHDIEYMQGVRKFLDFAFEKRSRDGKIVCPCKSCGNHYWETRIVVEHHLLFTGIMPGYTKWSHHGEAITLSVEDPILIEEETSFHLSSDMHHLLRDAFGHRNLDKEMHNNDINELGMDDEDMFDEVTHNGSPTEQNSEFHRFFEETNQSLYPGSDFSILSFVVKLMVIKCKNKWSDKSIEDLLKYLKEVFPQAKMPSSLYETKKIINALGLGYEKIDVCPNNCILYWGETVNDESCKYCYAPRWKLDEADNHECATTRKVKKKKPQKVLRYFPLIPRLQRLYMSSKTSSSMRWHDELRTKDGLLRHPADALAWKAFDQRYPHFAADSRNIRLGLASDGFNPSGMMSNTYSIWPIIVVPYNLPPWMCMKQESLILSTIIPGEKGPGDKIDVFLQPLIAELLQLWEGVETFDATSKQFFTMRAALMWTINDFPAHAYLSGWSTKGEKACPCCANDTTSRWLKNGGKHCYLGHRRWLDSSHVFRKRKGLFDGTEELRSPPIRMSGTRALRELEGVDFITENQDNNNTGGVLWKKKSIFFKLPYWEHQILRHNLDLMHLEKNVCENLIGTLLNVGKKKMENEKSRKDLALFGIRHQLHPQMTSNGRYVMPPASYHMSKTEVNLFLKVLTDIKVPDGYASNISRGVNLKERKLQSLKTHDYHVLMQDLLPVALRSCINDKVLKLITEISLIFKVVCSKTLDVEELEQLESRTALTLCHMEMIFPPSFFTIMTHLIIHIVEKAKIAGPVHYRWMYPIERCLKEFKNYPMNKAQPEASIAEKYVANECVIFCSRYLDGIETVFNRPRRNPDITDIERDKYLFGCAGKFIGATESVFLDEKIWFQAHRYVLFQHDEVIKYKEEFMRHKKRSLRNKRPTVHALDKLLSEEFPNWFKEHVSASEEELSDTIRQLAIGPKRYAIRCKGMILNGTRFYTKSRDMGKKTQNSGIVVKSQTTSYSSVRDQHPIDGDLDFFGELNDIIELDYHGKFKVVLFRCDWVDVTRGVKKDQFGFTVVNFSCLSHTGEHISHDPFILSSQAQRALYVQDPKYPEWYVAIKITARDVYDVGENFTEEIPPNIPQCNQEFEEPVWVRTDLEGDIYTEN